MTSDDRSKRLPAKPSGRHRSFGAYVLAWGALALLAAFYLTALALRPELVSEHLPVFRPGEPEGNQGQRAMSKALAEVQTLRQSVSSMQLDLAKLKADVGASQDHDRRTATRIAQLEEKIAAAQPALADATANAAPAAQGNVAARADARQLDTGRLETGSITTAKDTPPVAPALAAPAAVSFVQPKVINAPQPAPAVLAQTALATVTASPTTAAIAAKAPPPVASDAETAKLTSFGPATVTPAKAPEPAGPIGLRISNGPSLDALRLSWSLLADRHPAQLRNMEARYAARVPDGDADPTFDLIAGPVKSAAEAKRICKALAAKNIPCAISGFAGPSL